MAAHLASSHRRCAPFRAALRAAGRRRTRASGGGARCRRSSRRGGAGACRSPPPPRWLRCSRCCRRRRCDATAHGLIGARCVARKRLCYGPSRSALKARTSAAAAATAVRRPVRAAGWRLRRAAGAGCLHALGALVCERRVAERSAPLRLARHHLQRRRPRHGAAAGHEPAGRPSACCAGGSDAPAHAVHTPQRADGLAAACAGPPHCAAPPLAQRQLAFRRAARRAGCAVAAARAGAERQRRRRRAAC